jgi:hypothetical protein
MTLVAVFNCADAEGVAESMISSRTGVLEVPAEVGVPAKVMFPLLSSAKVTPVGIGPLEGSSA